VLKDGRKQIVEFLWHSPSTRSTSWLSFKTTWKHFRRVATSVVPDFWYSVFAFGIRFVFWKIFGIRYSVFWTEIPKTYGKKHMGVPLCVLSWISYKNKNDHQLVLRNKGNSPQLCLLICSPQISVVITCRQVYKNGKTKTIINLGDWLVRKLLS